MENSGKINELKTKIEQTLLPLIDGPYAFLDLPYYTNTGDTLIWEGTRQFLKKVPHKALYSSSANRYKLRNIAKNAVILLQGGGNFGNLWDKHQKFRIEVMKKYPANKIIVLPQSVCYTNENDAVSDAAQMAGHKNTLIFARDSVSFDFLKKYFKNNIGLLPDMAFCINPFTLQKYALPEENKSLLLKRTDKELSAGTDYEEVLKRMNFPPEIRDWPTLENDFHKARVLRRFISKKIYPEFIANWYADKKFRPAMIKEGVEFISPYKEIYTTRLHGAILAFLLGKSCKVIDNSYNKNTNFINTWLKESTFIK